jgi:hypothetical protein
VELGTPAGNDSSPAIFSQRVLLELDVARQVGIDWKDQAAHHSPSETLPPRDFSWPIRCSRTPATATLSRPSCFRSGNGPVRTYRHRSRALWAESRKSRKSFRYCAALTRLAIRAATEAVEAFPDGNWFVSLVDVRDPALVGITIARLLDVREMSDRPITRSIATFLAGKHALLILDNFEHV